MTVQGFWQQVVDFARQTMGLDLSISLDTRAHCDTNTLYGIRFDEVPATGNIIHSETSNGDWLWADHDWNRAVIHTGNPAGEAVKELLLIPVYTHLARNCLAIFLHASIVEYRGEALLFVGPSGIGKTTQAENWQKYLGAHILNGDKVFLRHTDSGILGFGSPWSGSSPYAVCRGVPARGIVVLRQSGANAIRRLLPPEVISLFMPHVYFPYWDKQAMENALAMLDLVVKEIPVHLLECVADEEAVVTARNAVFGLENPVSVFVG